MRFFILFAIGSATVAQPSFEVASVKQLATFRPGTNSEKIIAHPGTLSMQSVRLRTCIRWAFDLLDYQISGPDWLGDYASAGPGTDRFEIMAKVPEETPVAEMKHMLQRLLAERFKMVFHREKKEVPALALTVARSSNELKPSEDQSGRGVSWSTLTEFPFVSTTMAEFGEHLARFFGTAVIDRTGLDGRFDFTLKYPAELNREEYVSALPGMIKAQFGLELKRQRAQVEFLIIDALDKKPIAN